MYSVSVFKNKNDILDNPMATMHSVNKIKPWFCLDADFNANDMHNLTYKDISTNRIRDFEGSAIESYADPDHPSVTYAYPVDELLNHVVKVVYGVHLIDEQTGITTSVTLDEGTAVYVANDQNKTVNTFRHKVKYMFKDEYEDILRQRSET